MTMTPKLRHSIAALLLGGVVLGAIVLLFPGLVTHPYAELPEVVHRYLLSRLSADNHAVAIELASIPEDIRGYGHVKAQHLKAARARWTALLARYRGQQSAQVIQMPVKAA